MLSNSTKEAIIKSLDKKGLFTEIPDPRTRGQYADFLRALREVRRSMADEYGADHQFVTEMDSVIDPMSNLVQFVEQSHEAFNCAIVKLAETVINTGELQKLGGGLRDTLRDIIRKAGNGDSEGAGRMLNLKDLSDAKKNGGDLN